MRYSIIIPHCHGQRESASQRQDLQIALRRAQACELLTKFSGCPTIDHAVIAGLRAARGEIVVVIEPGDRYPLTQLSALVRALSRADFVCGRRRRQGWPKLTERLGRLPRWLLLGLDSRDPDCLFWAARREVFNGLQLLPRFVRFLPSLVARQGYRVDSIYVEERSSAAAARATESLQTATSVRAAPANLLTAWWTCRKLRAIEPGAGPSSANRTETSSPPIRRVAKASAVSELH
jgi:hypothetical protein